MDIYFCDVCCARVTAGHLQRGFGVRNKDIIVCGSCVEQGHGAELLKIDVDAEEAVLAAAAAPRLAGADSLDDARDRAPTMKGTESGSSELAAEIKSNEINLSDDDLSLDGGDDEPTLDSGELDAVADEAAPELEESAELEVADEAAEEKVLESAELELEDADQDEDVLAQSQSDSIAPDDAPDATEALEAAAAEVSASNIEDEIESSASINIKDAEDDLEDSGAHPIQEPLDDADDDHTDSYSADELAAIKRLAEKEKEEEEAADSRSSSSVVSSGRSSGRRKTASSSRRSTAQSGRKSSGKKSGRKSTAKLAAKSPGKASGKSGKSSSRSSRKTSSRAKAQQKMPMPLMVSFVSIPLLIIIFIIIALNTGSGPANQPQTYEINVTGLNMKVDHVYRFAQSAYQEEDYEKLREAQRQIRDVMGMKNEVVAKMEASGYSDNQMDKSLRKFRKLMQLERAVRDKIEEVKSRMGK